ncbi:hypothetical protein CRUP_038491 [Coryphaenoides rupestris]|nr:hypothetical protein CRUP_038491 [Coryphaenoides rupestris]
MAGFNPMWEETLVFTLHMPELALVRFLVWDHDPIGQDFIGQRTIAFNSMMTGYRHVYLEGMEEASIFVHIAVHDITGKHGVFGLGQLLSADDLQDQLLLHLARQGVLQVGVKGTWPRGHHEGRTTELGPVQLEHAALGLVVQSH